MAGRRNVGKMIVEELRVIVPGQGFETDLTRLGAKGEEAEGIGARRDAKSSAPVSTSVLNK